MRAHDFVARLSGVRGSGPWTARCPAHEDTNPSLSVREAADGKILLRCFAGCSVEAVVAALGLSLGDLFAAESRGTGRWSQEDAERALRLRGLRPETVRYFRIEPDLAKQAWSFPLGRGRSLKFKAFVKGRARSAYWSEHAQLDTYHLEPCRGRPEAWLLEGEPDVWVGHQAGLVCFSLTGGAGNINDALARDIARASIGMVRVLYDCDEAGRSGAAKVAGALTKAGCTAVVHELPKALPPGSDVTSLYCDLGCNDASLREYLAALPTTEVAQDDSAQARSRALGEAAIASVRGFARITGWGLRELETLIGGLVAGWLIVLGGRPGTGKTTFLLSLLSRLWEDRIPTLYFGTEMGPESLVQKWAALRLGLDELAVFESRLNAEEQGRLEAEVAALTAQPSVAFCRSARLDIERLRSELAWAFEPTTGLSPRVVILDHIHRVSQEREELEALAQELKQVAIERSVCLIAAAQLNREKDIGPLDLYSPPSLARYKGSAAIEENADVALGLFRPLRGALSAKERRALMHGETSVADYAEPERMGVVCLKHRYHGPAAGRAVRLVLRAGQVGEPPFRPALPTGVVCSQCGSLGALSVVLGGEPTVLCPDCARFAREVRLL